MLAETREEIAKKAVKNFKKYDESKIKKYVFENFGIDVSLRGNKDILLKIKDLLKFNDYIK